MARYGIVVTIDNVLITTGSQEALDLIGKVLINPGDKVLTEEPTYLGAMQAFTMYGAEYVTVLPEPIDTGELLREAIRERVAFVPGTAFHPYRGGRNTMRLNFSNASEEMIQEGIARLGRAILRQLRPERVVNLTAR